jgi:tryptophanyl-tRNA synthetase
MSRILSGIRPTGGLHIGNYLGAVKQWVELSQEPDSECFFMIADYHALLSFRETPLDQATYDLLAWELASGLDPNQVTLFVQSFIPAHTELAWIFNALATVPELSRMTQYKDLIAHGLEQPSSALLTYPLLQAADILLYKADFVPVGEDQVQHIELTRTIARRFNKQVGIEIFPEPKPRLTDGGYILSLHDPTKKMSKSMPQGALLLEDDEATLRAKISKAVTDTGLDQAEMPDMSQSNETLSLEEKALLYQHMSPGVRNLFILLEQTTTDPHIVNVLLENYKTHTLQYRDLKAALADSVVSFILPLQEKYRDFRSDESRLQTILREGSAKAEEIANQTLQEAKRAFHLAS